MKEDYPIFKKWMAVLDWILDQSEKLPKNVRFTISSRLSNYALDMMEFIIEAIYNKNRVPILNKMNITVEKLRVLFRICYTRKYISVTQYEFISRELEETGKMIGGWKKEHE